MLWNRREADFFKNLYQEMKYKTKKVEKVFIIGAIFFVNNLFELLKIW